MVNLVRQNDILHLIDWYQTEYCEAEIYFEEFRRDIESWTGVDAVPVVRCADCKYSDTYSGEEDCEMPLKCLSIRYGGVYPDWFCEHGKYREEAHDGE